MEPNKISDNVAELTQNVKDYIQLRIDLMMLRITGKVAKLVSSMMLAITFFIIFVLCTFFVSLAFIFWYKDNVGTATAACFIIAGFYLFLGIIVYASRTKLFVNPVLSQFSKIILEEDNHESTL